jgi:hypothetical protein
MSYFLGKRIRGNNNNNSNKKKRINICAICLYGIENQEKEICLVCEQEQGKKFTQHCFHDGCIYSMLKTLNPPYKCPNCRAKFKNVIYEKETIPLQKFISIYGIKDNYLFRLKKYIRLNNDETQEEVYKIIYIIKEVIERMIYYYGITYGYNISIKQSNMLKLYDDVINSTEKNSKEHNIDGTLTSLIDYLEKNVNYTHIRGNDKKRYMNDDDAYIIYKETGEHADRQPKELKIDPKIWHYYDPLLDFEIRSNYGRLGNFNCIRMIFKLQTLEKEIDEILNYFNGDDKHEYITSKYKSVLEKILKLFINQCFIDEKGNFIYTNLKYCFEIPDEEEHFIYNSYEDEKFETWFNRIFFNATGYTSIENVTGLTMYEKSRHLFTKFVDSIRSPGRGGTRKRRRTKRRKKKKNLKKSYKK